MHLKTLYIYESIKLFEVLNEIKNYLNFEIAHIEQKKNQRNRFQFI